MHILHISKYAYPERGGIETFVRDLTVQQKRQGHTVALLCHRATSLSATKVQQTGGVSITRSGILCNFPFAPFSLQFPLQLNKQLKKQRPDVIHLHMPNIAILFFSIIPTDIPLVVHWHADVQGSPHALIHATYPLYRYFEKKTLSRAARIIATSPPYMESSPSLLHWKEKCEIVPLGLDQGRYPASPMCSRSDHPLIISVGRFSFYKGFEYLVRAAALTPEAELVIAGDGPTRSRISAEVERLNLSARVSLPGNVTDEELRILLQRADIFCLPSVNRGEAFGVAIIEAMHYGLPLVTTAIPGSGTGWVNQDGVTGRVVRPESPKELAVVIKEIINDPHIKTAFGKAARQRLDTNFTIAKVGRSIEHIYNQITD